MPLTGRRGYLLVDIYDKKKIPSTLCLEENIYCTDDDDDDDNTNLAGSAITMG